MHVVIEVPKLWAIFRVALSMINAWMYNLNTLWLHSFVTDLSAWNKDNVMFHYPSYGQMVGTLIREVYSHHWASDYQLPQSHTAQLHCVSQILNNSPPSAGWLDYREWCTGEGGGGGLCCLLSCLPSLLGTLAQLQSSVKRPCTGKSVTITCTVPSAGHQWNIPPLNITCDLVPLDEGRWSLITLHFCLMW